MEWDKVKQAYPKGKRLKVTISQVEDFGAFVDLSEGIRGFLPTEELSWTGSILDARKMLKINDSIEVIVLDFNNKYNNVLLSLREAEGDPRRNIDKFYKIGEVVTGSVIHVTKNCAFIDIENKYQGVIDISRIWMNVEKMDDALLVGDELIAKIIGIDHKERIINLSVSDLFIEEERSNKTESTETLEESHQDIFDRMRFNLEIETEREIGLTEAAKEKIKRILIVDPDEKLGSSTAQMLEDFHFETDYATSADEAIQKFKALLADFILSALSIGDKDGIYLFQTLRKDFPRMQIVFQTAQDDLKNYLNELEDLNLQNCILIKPWQLNDLIRFVNEAAEGSLGQTQLHLRDQDDFNFLDRISRTSDKQVDKKKTVQSIITDLKEVTGASFTILFQQHLKTLETQIVAACGLNKELTNEDTYLLRFSPVKDVIYDQENLYINKAIGKRYKHLRTLGNFSSIIGEKINLSSNWGFGLFLFGIEESSFNVEDIKNVKITSNILATILERKHLEDIYKKQHKFIVAGRLSSAMIHELKNEQQAIYNNIEILRTDSTRLNAGKLRADDTEFPARFQRIVNSLMKGQDKIDNINRIFLNLFKEGADEELDFMEHLNQLIEAIKPTSQKQNINIIPVTGNIPKSKINCGRLDQIITNILINSIEQIPSIRKSNGEIKINVGYKKEDELPIKIEISDNGPGIHNVHCEQIFDIFFTTKPHGSGLGLYISKALVESMNGRISIKETVRFQGTTFLIELPMVKKESA